MKKYKRLVKEIRKKSFPEIKGIILIIRIPFPIPGGATFWLFPRINILAFSTACKKLDKKVMTGLIAHELSHFSIFQRGTWFAFLKFLMKINKKRMIENERETDLLTIKKGYGEELIATKIKAKELLKGTIYEKVFKNSYLTAEEVRKKMKEKK
jgi:hypothetical protein